MPSGATNGMTTAYAANNMNQYSGAGTTTFAYDRDGNLVEETAATGTRRYFYDVLIRFTRVETPEGVDFTLPNGTVDFAIGERTKSIAIPLVNDLLDEENVHDSLIQFSLPILESSANQR